MAIAMIMLLQTVCSICRKAERVRRKTYKTCKDAHLDVLDDIELFYNPIGRRADNKMLLPIESEMAVFIKIVVYDHLRDHPHDLRRVRRGCHHVLFLEFDDLPN